MAEPAAEKRNTASEQVDPEPGSQDAAERIERALRWGLPLVSLVGTIVVSVLLDFGTGLLVLAGGVLLGIVAILWASVRTLAGDAPLTLEEAVALGAPSATEEQKRAVLQALKDLEYERSVGKVSDADYEELRQRYREEGKRLLRAVDEDLAPLRAKANAYLAERLGRSGGASPIGSAVKSRRACSSCQADNDVDAVFCKKCGGKLEAPKESRDATA